jgi:hypothetical protein
MNFKKMPLKTQGKYGENLHAYLIVQNAYTHVKNGKFFSYEGTYPVRNHGKFLFTPIALNPVHTQKFLLNF